MYPNRQYVGKTFVKSCDRCPGLITFAKNRSGKWFAVDAHSVDEGATWFYRRNGFNNNNIPGHRCVPLEDLQRQRLVAQAKQLLGCIGHSMLRACNPLDQERMDRLAETYRKASIRLQRREGGVNGNQA